MAEHTKTPWRLDFLEIHDRRYGLNGIVSADDESRLLIKGSGGAESYTRFIAKFDKAVEDEANAAFIVRAVNLHDDLVAALRKIAAIDGPPFPETYDGYGSMAVVTARAALSKLGY
jgi:hypothetical protein